MPFARAPHPSSWRAALARRDRGEDPAFKPNHQTEAELEPTPAKKAPAKKAPAKKAAR